MSSKTRTKSNSYYDDSSESEENDIEQYYLNRGGGDFDDEVHENSSMNHNSNNNDNCCFMTLLLTFALVLLVGILYVFYPSKRVENGPKKNKGRNSGGSDGCSLGGSIEAGGPGPGPEASGAGPGPRGSGSFVVDEQKISTELTTRSSLGIPEFHKPIITFGTRLEKGPMFNHEGTINGNRGSEDIIYGMEECSRLGKLVKGSVSDQDLETHLKVRDLCLSPRAFFANYVNQNQTQFFSTNKDTRIEDPKLRRQLSMLRRRLASNAPWNDLYKHGVEGILNFSEDSQSDDLLAFPVVKKNIMLDRAPTAGLKEGVLEKFRVEHETLSFRAKRLCHEKYELDKSEDKTKLTGMQQQLWKINTTAEPWRMREFRELQASVDTLEARVEAHPIRVEHKAVCKQLVAMEKEHAPLFEVFSRQWNDGRHTWNASEAGLADRKEMVARKKKEEEEKSLSKEEKKNKTDKEEEEEAKKEKEEIQRNNSYLATEGSKWLENWTATTLKLKQEEINECEKLLRQDLNGSAYWKDRLEDLKMDLKVYEDNFGAATGSEICEVEEVLEVGSSFITSDYFNLREHLIQPEYRFTGPDGTTDKAKFEAEGGESDDKEKTLEGYLDNSTGSLQEHPLKSRRGWGQKLMPSRPDLILDGGESLEELLTTMAGNNISFCQAISNCYGRGFQTLKDAKEAMSGDGKKKLTGSEFMNIMSDGGRLFNGSSADAACIRKNSLVQGNRVIPEDLIPNPAGSESYIRSQIPKTILANNTSSNTFWTEQEVDWLLHREVTVQRLYGVVAERLTDKEISALLANPESRRLVSPDFMKQHPTAEPPLERHRMKMVGPGERICELRVRMLREEEIEEAEKKLKEWPLHFVVRVVEVDSKTGKDTENFVEQKIKSKMGSEDSKGKQIMTYGQPTGSLVGKIQLFETQYCHEEVALAVVKKSNKNLNTTGSSDSKIEVRLLFNDCRREQLTKDFAVRKWTGSDSRSSWGSSDTRRNLSEWLTRSSLGQLKLEAENFDKSIKSWTDELPERVAKELWQKEEERKRSDEEDKKKGLSLGFRKLFKF